MILFKGFKVFIRRSICSNCYEINQLLCQHNVIFQTFSFKPIENSNYRRHKLYGGYFGYFILCSYNMHWSIFYSNLCSIFFINFNWPYTDDSYKWICCSYSVWNIPFNFSWFCISCYSMLFNLINRSKIKRRQIQICSITFKSNLIRSYI